MGGGDSKRTRSCHITLKKVIDIKKKKDKIELKIFDYEHTYRTNRNKNIFTKGRLTAQPTSILLVSAAGPFWSHI